jgi:thioredoxin
MKQSAYEFKLRKNPRPVVVEFWAPWCGPCKVMAPSLKKAEEVFLGKVDLWKINADENPELLRGLGVMGIPTMIGYYGGQEVSRRTGGMTAENVQAFFEAVQNNQAFSRSLSVLERAIRIVPALALLLLGWFNGQNYWLMAVGGVLLFSAFYDRCPVFKVVSAQVKSWLKKPTSNI